MSEKKVLNNEQLEKVSGGTNAVYSDEVDKDNVVNYVGGPLYFVGNQTFINSSYVQYVEIFAHLNSVSDKTYEKRSFFGLSTNVETSLVTKKVYSVKVMSGNCEAGSVMDLIADGFKVYLSKA